MTRKTTKKPTSRALSRPEKDVGSGLRKDRVRFKYLFNEGYNPTYVNGAFAGATPHGELAISFYLERPPLPYEEVHELINESRVGQRVDRSPAEQADEVSVVRFVSTGVVLSIDGAKKIRDLLNRMIDSIEQVQQQKQQKAVAQS